MSCIERLKEFPIKYQQSFALVVAEIDIAVSSGPSSAITQAFGIAWYLLDGEKELAVSVAKAARELKTSKPAVSVALECLLGRTPYREAVRLTQLTESQIETIACSLVDAASMGLDCNRFALRENALRSLKGNREPDT